MNAVYSNEQLIGYSDTLVYIKLAQNGSYVASDIDNAEGFCVKIPKTFVNEETGETYSAIADTVFRLSENGLNNTEPIAYIVKEDANTIAAKALDEALNIMQGME